MFSKIPSHARRYKKIGLLLTIALIVFVSAATAFAASRKVPQFTLPLADGSGVFDSNDYKGKVLLVNFWATWCPPCREEIPSLMKLHEKYAPKGFSVVGISMDEGGKRIVKKFMDKLSINYPVVMGNSQAARDFGGVIGIPQTFLVDREGTIVKRYQGLIDHSQFDKDINDLF